MSSTSNNLNTNPTTLSNPSLPSTPSHPSKPSSRKPPLSLANLPDLLTVREVADVLRVSPLTIKRWGKKGHLPFVRINSRGDRRYKKEAVLWKLGISPAD